MLSITEILAQELGQKTEYIENVITLMDEGNTIPFIARYRKEMHGAMDDTTLRTLETRLTYLRNLQARRDPWPPCSTRWWEYVPLRLLPWGRLMRALKFSCGSWVSSALLMLRVM